MLALPTPGALDLAAAEMTCAAGENLIRIRQIRKARYTLGCGINIVPNGADVEVVAVADNQIVTGFRNVPSQCAV
jgi:hypothetical protein